MRSTTTLLARWRHAMVAVSLVGAVLMPLSLSAAGQPRGDNLLTIKGYQAYTNVVFLNPTNPTILEVRTGGEGGAAHLGKMRSWSSDQRSDLISGLVTATYTFEDKNGD